MKRLRRQTGRPDEAADSDIVLVHSSDLHVDTDYNANLYGGDGTFGLRCVLNTARELGADVVLLAGDMFENNRLPDHVVRRAADLIDGFGRPVVILPGNHDPATDQSAHHRAGLAGVGHAAVLGITHRSAVRFADLDLEVWGRAHRNYDDMLPLGYPRKRRARWHVAMAHGHYTARPDRSTPYRPSWLISAAELAATDADYVALGHWNRPARVGGAAVKAWYSGAPELARTVNRVRLTPAGQTLVTRKPIAWR